MNSTTPSPPESTVVVLGDVLIDEMRTPTESIDVPGGSALNVAVGLAVLGIRPLLVGMVGDDASGALIRAHVHAHDVPLLSTPAPLGTGRAISDRAAGEPRYSFSQASRSRSLVPTSEARQAIGRADVVVISGFPFDDASEVATLQELLRPGAKVMIDANPRSGLLHERAAFADGLLTIAPRADLVKMGEEDAELVFSASLPETTALILDAGARAVLETMGSGGAAIVTPTDRVTVPITTAAGPVIDTMGAGDATFATVVASLATSGDRVPEAPEVMLSRAMAVAAATVRSPGGLLRLPE